MYDIEVIEGSNYAVISEGSPAYEFLKAMNTKLLMKKLAGDSGEQIVLNVSEIIPLCRGFKLSDLQRLVDVDLIEHQVRREFDMVSSTYKLVQTYTFTSYGLEVMKHIKDFGGDVEIWLN